jgi:hypothetical protein
LAIGYGHLIDGNPATAAHFLLIETPSPRTAAPDLRRLTGLGERPMGLHDPPGIGCSAVNLGTVPVGFAAVLVPGNEIKGQNGGIADHLHGGENRYSANGELTPILLQKSRLLGLSAIFEAKIIDP